MFGVPNAVMGELVHAAVVLRCDGEAGAGVPPQAGELIAWCRARMAAYKVRVTDFPLSMLCIAFACKQIDQPAVYALPSPV